MTSWGTFGDAGLDPADAGPFVSESDRELAEMIALAEHEREMGRIRAELGLGSDGGGNSGVE
jgi:hypothetical protein